MFLPQPVPRELVNEALALAQDAPSNSNIQPWPMVFASGASRDRLVAALLDEAQRRPPNILPCPRRSSTFATSWALKSTGRWEALARTL
jgi:nitroreductase